MEMPVNSPVEMSFIESGDAHILCTYFVPDGESKETLIFLPSMAEEMNRCRVMVAMQARYLANKGIGVVLVDYYGTGDSEGHFRDTNWDTWKQNVLDASAWVENKGLIVMGLWGLRMGAMLATEISAENPGRFKKLVLWQPVSNGKIYFTQLLRMRMAAQMNGDAVVEKPDQVRDRFDKGEFVAIGGYLYSPILAKQIDTKKMSEYDIDDKVTIDWFESIRSSDASVPAVSQEIHQQWLEKGVELSVHGFVGDAFWQMPERTLAPELVDLTTKVLSL